MSVRRLIAQTGGSLSLVIPRDAAEMMGIKKGSPVRLSWVGRQMVVEPEDETVPEASFRRAFATVLRRHGDAFDGLAKFDAGLKKKP